VEDPNQTALTPLDRRRIERAQERRKRRGLKRLDVINRNTDTEPTPKKMLFGGTLYDYDDPYMRSVREYHRLVSELEDTGLVEPDELIDKP